MQRGVRYYHEVIGSFPAPSPSPAVREAPIARKISAFTAAYAIILTQASSGNYRSGAQV